MRLFLVLAIALTGCNDKILSKKQIAHETPITLSECRFVCGTSISIDCDSDGECTPIVETEYCDGYQRRQWDIRYYRVAYARGDEPEGDVVTEREETYTNLEACH